MTAPDAILLPERSSRAVAFALLAAGIAGLSGCDRMKRFIDPNGTAYGKADAPAPAPAPAEKAGKPAPAPATTAPPPPVPRGAAEVMVREKEPGRFLTESVIETQLPDIDFTIGRSSFRLVRGIHRDRSGIVTARDSAGRFWGVAIGDLNMDGTDDAVLLLRTDKPGGETTWDLAYLPNREGRLHDVQTVRLPGDLGYGDVAIEGSEVLLVPVDEGPNVHLSYSGGELRLSDE